MKLNEYIAFQHEKNSFTGQPIPAIECKDGFTISIQASVYHYCKPRYNIGPWTHVECGFPSDNVPSMAEYKDGPDSDKESVFGFVPIGIIEDIIKEHGGLTEK